MLSFFGMSFLGEALDLMYLQSFDYPSWVINVITIVNSTVYTFLCS